MPPPARKPVGAQRRRIDLADEQRVLPFAIQIRRPEVELIFRRAASLEKDQRVRANAALGIGQIEGNLRRETVMFANDERRSARFFFETRTRVAGNLSQLLPAADAPQQVQFRGQFSMHNFGDKIRRVKEDDDDGAEYQAADQQRLKKASALL